MKILNTNNTCDDVDDNEVVTLINDYTTRIGMISDDKVTPPPLVDDNTYIMNDATIMMKQQQ